MAVSATLRAEANLRGAISCIRNESALQTNSLVMRAARSLWPKKTALELSMRTGVSERMAHYWLAQKFSISAEALASLLRSDAGLVVLENLMGEARPVWWRRIKRSASLSSLRAAQAAHQKQIEQYELEFADEE